jgi:RecJ-like exonuclease
MTECVRCDGCGQIANSEDGAPWSAWESLPVRSALAVDWGLVRPIPCPDCAGSGTANQLPEGQR